MPGPVDPVERGVLCFLGIAGTYVSTAFACVNPWAWFGLLPSVGACGAAMREGGSSSEELDVDPEWREARKQLARS